MELCHEAGGWGAGQREYFSREVGLVGKSHLMCERRPRRSGEPLSSGECLVDTCDPAVAGERDADGPVEPSPQLSITHADDGGDRRDSDARVAVQQVDRPVGDGVSFRPVIRGQYSGVGDKGYMVAC